MTRREEYAAQLAEARERADAIAQLNAISYVGALIARDEENAKRKREQRGRDEVVNYFMRPGSLEALAMARATIQAPVLASDSKLPSKICWMPRGDHEICAGTMAGGTWSGLVRCDELGANNVIASFGEMIREGWRPFIDVAHNRAEAAGWVHGFSWDPAVGIMCSVEWTSLGETSIRDRIFMSFSPCFCVDNETGRVTGIVKNEPVGALVNTPAFGTAMPPITAAGRSVAAQLMRTTLIANGHSHDTAERVANAIEDGFDGAAIALLLQSLNG